MGQRPFVNFIKKTGNLVLDGFPYFLVILFDWKMMMDDDDDDDDGGGDDGNEGDGDGDDSDDCGKDDNGGNVHCALEGGAQLGPGSLLLQCPPPPR